MYLRLLFLFLLPVHILFAQTTVLELKNIPIVLPDHSFYISKVIDGRKDSSLIGRSSVNKDTRGFAYLLKDGLTKSFEHYFSGNLMKDSTSTPLVMNVSGLMVTERKKLMVEGTAQLIVQFYKEEEGQFGKVFETTVKTSSTSEIGRDIYTTHERRIRIVLNNSLKQLSESKWKETKPDFISLTELMQESLHKDTLSAKITDTTYFSKTIKTDQQVVYQHQHIVYTKKFIPKFELKGKIKHSLWPYAKAFAASDPKVTKLYKDYKAKVRLSVFVLAVAGAFIGSSFVGENYSENGIPTIGLLIPGSVLLACTVPVYLKSNKLAYRTVDAYNNSIENK